MAASKESGNGIAHECFYRCDSRVHSSNLTAALTKSNLSDEKVAAYLKWCCIKYPLALDSNGRSLIHVAAAKGRLKLLTFLLAHRDVDINGKDRESMYTALHRSLFYGQLHCAIRLIQLGANLEQIDSDFLTPIDHVMKDRPEILEYNLNNPCEAYVWGTNINYSLGIGHYQSRTNPEPLEVFRKQNISIKQVAMSKFHSVFVGSDGHVWSCGHNSGGRLGLDNEVTTLEPKLIQFKSQPSYSAQKSPNVSHTCISACVANDHTVLLMDNGSVWTFGLNKYHQLGHVPPPPKILSPKIVKTVKNVIGIAASKFHTVIWTENQLHACGLNGGQLGHLKGDVTVIVPKVVTSLKGKNWLIKHVATSEGATVIVNDRGEMYLLHEYQCKKILSRSRDNKMVVSKICVIGGNLDHKIYPSDLKEKGGGEVKILVITTTGSLLLWQENTLQLNRCLLSLRRHIKITDIALNNSLMLLTTSDGEAFYGEVRVKKKKTDALDITKVASPKSKFKDSEEKDDFEHVKLRRIPHIHRAVKITSDSKGRNFSCIQVHPRSGLLQVPFVDSSDMRDNMKTLLESADEFDNIHDVVFEVNNMRFPAHQFILCHASEVFEDMIKKADVVVEIPVVQLENVLPQIFQRILHFVYTGDCDFFYPGISPISLGPAIDNDLIIDDLDNVNEEMISAYEYNNKKRSAMKKKQSRQPPKNDPVYLLKESAKRFGLNALQKKLELVRFENGYIFNTSEKIITPGEVKFDRKRFVALRDVSLEAEDGIEIKAHKCILVGRMEYFNCMISQGWLESSQKSAIKMPLPGNALQILIDYLYTDEASALNGTDDCDLASLSLVVADQYFCTRLKEYAETSLVSLMSLRNAAEILQLSLTYHAPQLKQSAMEFICLNLPALLESRSLEILDDEVLCELRDFYRSWLPCMSRRRIATDHSAPDDAFVDVIFNTEPVSLDSVLEEPIVAAKPSSAKKQKKNIKEKKGNQTGRLRNASLSSATSDDESFNMSSLSVSLEKEETWVKVVNHPTKQQKILKSRLKVAMEADKIQPTPIQLTKLENPTKSPAKKELIEAEKNLLNLSTSSEIDFPSLNASPVERHVNVTNPRFAEGPKKFTKLSQKQRKRLATLSTSEDEDACKTPEPVKSAWGQISNESFSFSEIMKQNMKHTSNKHKSMASSPLWFHSSASGSNLTEIMAAEKQQKELALRMKSKPLEYTQMEDKAIDDLLLLYDVHNVTDERITVSRADNNVFISPPVWVPNHR